MNFTLANKPRRHRAADGRAWWCLALAMLPLAAGLAQQKSGVKEAATWETLEGCRLVTNSIVDGDSFHVLHQDREYVFRLYFVDAPESDVTLKERVRDQAAHFQIAPEDIPRAGKLASRFTRELLSQGSFTVMTRWQNALGRSSLARYYAIVTVKGTNLAEALVTHGWARVHGLRANWPDGPRSSRFTSKLKGLEVAAREQKRGLWDEASFPRAPDATAGTPAMAGPAKSGDPVGPLDINTASYEELLALPGIGPALAKRILAHRPFQKVDDLDDVPGIGPSLMKRLTPLVRVGNTPP